jgi:hypothetical protein
VLSELAPEQIQARDTLDPRSDVFVAGNTLRELIARCRVTQPTPLDDVWRRATATLPKERYLSAHELAYAVSRVAQDAGLTSTPEELASWVRAGLPEERGAELPPPSRPVSSALSASWGEHAPLHDDSQGFVPPRISLPRAIDTSERMSSVWYAVETKPTDDGVARAIASSFCSRAEKPRASTKPLRLRRRPWFHLRTLGSGIGLGCVALWGMIAVGGPRQAVPASASATSTPVARPPSPAASVAPAASAAPAGSPASAAPPAAAPPVPAEVLAPIAPTPEPAAEPGQRSERPARRAQARSLAVEPPVRELIRMTGSVPDNPY